MFYFIIGLLLLTAYMFCIGMMYDENYIENFKINTEKLKVGSINMFMEDEETKPIERIKMLREKLSTEEFEDMDLVYITGYKEKYLNEIKKTFLTTDFSHTYNYDNFLIISKINFKLMNEYHFVMSKNDEIINFIVFNNDINKYRRNVKKDEYLIYIGEYNNSNIGKVLEDTNSMIPKMKNIYGLSTRFMIISNDDYEQEMTNYILIDRFYKKPDEYLFETIDLETEKYELPVFTTVRDKRIYNEKNILDVESISKYNMSLMTFKF